MDFPLLALNGQNHSRILQQRWWAFKSVFCHWSLDFGLELDNIQYLIYLQTYFETWQNFVMSSQY